MRSPASPAGCEPRVYRWPMSLVERARPTSQRVAPRKSRSADLSRRYKLTASARFPGRCRAYYVGSAGDQEPIPRIQYYGGTSLYPHLDLACDNVADLFSRMSVPSGLDSRRNQRLHLHHLATWNRQQRALDLAPIELACQIVPCP